MIHSFNFVCAEELPKTKTASWRKVLKEKIK